MKFSRSIDNVSSDFKKMSIIIVSYMLLMIMYRFVLPYGDEPDFSVRVSDILYGDLIFYSPYSFSKYYVFLLPFIFYTMSSSGRYHPRDGF